MTDWTPETNRIPTRLLTPEELAALKAAEHGWEVFDDTTWSPIFNPFWHLTSTYRAKPAPKRIVTWHNVYPEGVVHYETSREIADKNAGSRRTCVYRIERNEDGSDPQIFVEDV